MPSRTTRITDISSQLGLRGPYSQKTADWKSSPAVHKLYKTDIAQLCKDHATKSMDTIPGCAELKDAAARLLTTYGPLIWSDHDHRPWLFNVGEGSPEAPYAKQRYYSNLIDREFLRETLHRLLIEKTIRWRAEHSRTSLPSRAVSDPAWTPATSPAPSRRRSRASLMGITCFADTTSHLSHLDADALAKHGIWLGDYDDEKAVVNGPSQNDVEKDYFEKTSGGLDCSRAEPYAFDVDPGIREMYLECAGCKIAGRTSERLKIELHGFEWEDDVTEKTKMEKNIWLLPCTLRRRQVFAYVAELPEKEWKRMGSKLPLWSFWQVNGGYHSKIFLTPCTSGPPMAILESDIVTPAHQEKGKKRARDRTPAGDPGPSSKRPARCEITDHGSFATVDGTTAPSPTGSGGTVIRQRRPSFDSDYDVTPAPNTARAQPNSPMPVNNRVASAGQELLEQLVQAFIQGSEASHTSPVEERAYGTIASRHIPATNSNPARTSTHAIIPMQPPAFSVRFRVWFNMDGQVGRYAVLLDDSMSVQDMYTRVQQQLRRPLAGRTLLALRLTFEAHQDPMDAYNVDADDTDGWDGILELVRETGSSKLYGTIDAS